MQRHMPTRSLRAAAAGSSLLALFAAVPCAAQGSIATAAADAPAAALSSDIGDIIVIARRRAEASQSVPIAITAIDNGELRRQNVTTSQDLQGKVPSLVVGSMGQTRKSEIFFIRGQGATLGAGPGVVSYFAEVPLPQDSVLSAQGGGSGMYYDLQSIQVLKGPQGTLFGRNTTGGAVLIEPQRPKDTFGGYIQGTIGNYDDREVEAMLNLPIVEDKLLVRIAGRFQDRDGFTKDIVTGKDYDNKHNYSGRIGITFRPNADIENYLMAYYFGLNDNGTGSVIGAFNDKGPTAAYNAIYGPGFLQAIVAAQRARGPRRVQLSADPFNKLQTWGVTDNLNLTLNDTLTLRNIISYAELRNVYRQDGDGSLLAIVDQINPKGTWMTDMHEFTEELQLQGNLLGDKLNFVLGGYLQNDTPEDDQVTYSAGFVFPGIPRPAAYTVSRYAERRRSRALYAQGTLDFGAFSPSLDGLKLTAGFRYTWDKKRIFNDYYDGANSCPAVPGKTVPNCVRNLRFAYAEPTWTVGLDYKVTRDVLLYAKVSRGYKQGGFTERALNPLYQAVKPEFVTSYEGGVKSQFRLAGMPIRLNADYYFTDYSDLQKTGGAIYMGRPTAASYNVGRAHIQGVEIESTIIPFRGFELSASYSYLDAKYIDFDIPVGDGSTTIDLHKNPFQFAPKNIVSINARYTLPLDPSIGEITAGMGYSYTGRQYTSPVDPPSVEPYAYNRAYGLLNFSLDWNGIGGSGFDASAFMTNATNNLYTISAYPVYGSIGFTSYIYGEPRMYGLRLRYRFGER